MFFDNTQTGNRQTVHTHPANILAFRHIFYFRKKNKSQKSKKILNKQVKTCAPPFSWRLSWCFSVDKSQNMINNVLMCNLTWHAFFCSFLVTMIVFNKGYRVWKVVNGRLREAKSSGCYFLGFKDCGAHKKRNSAHDHFLNRNPSRACMLINLHNGTGGTFNNLASFHLGSFLILIRIMTAGFNAFLSHPFSTSIFSLLVELVLLIPSHLLSHRSLAVTSEHQRVLYQKNNEDKMKIFQICYINTIVLSWCYFPCQKINLLFLHLVDWLVVSITDLKKKCLRFICWTFAFDNFFAEAFFPNIN